MVKLNYYYRPEFCLVSGNDDRIAKVLWCVWRSTIRVCRRRQALCRKICGQLLVQVCDLLIILTQCNIMQYNWLKASLVSFRVYVTNIISDCMVSVYFCDYGDVTIVPRSSLQPLKSEFLELPYQAVKAKLVGKRNILFHTSIFRPKYSSHFFSEKV